MAVVAVAAVFPSVDPVVCSDDHQARTQLRGNGHASQKLQSLPHCPEQLALSGLVGGMDLKPDPPSQRLTLAHHSNTLSGDPWIEIPDTV